MVEVVKLGRGQEGQVVSTVRDGGADQSHTVPHTGGRQVRVQQDGSDGHREHVRDLRKNRYTSQQILVLRAQHHMTPVHLKIHFGILLITFKALC